ncbi:MAG: GH116 family glycosyl hydrolase [Acidobacteriaceae bacterium]
MVRSCSRREFMQHCGEGLSLAALSALLPNPAAAQETAVSDPAHGFLFSTGGEARVWRQFRAAGFPGSVAGALFRGSNPPCCGMPLGGVSTGCIDLDVRGVCGFSSIFNPWSKCTAVANWRMPRKPQLMSPLLGLSVADKVWVLAMPEVVRGGSLPVCQDPFFGHPAEKADTRELPPLEQVLPAQEIHYFGHYPVVDVEFETTAPISVGLRAWAPFIPGDLTASNVPAIVFEVHLRNNSSTPQSGSLAFNFPGPDPEEALGFGFARMDFREDITGLHIVSSGGVGYVLACDDPHVRTGAAMQPSSWKQMARELPQPQHNPAAGGYEYQDGGASLAANFDLHPGEEKVSRFFLTWYAPTWKGAERERLKMLQPLYAGSNRTEWNASQWSDANYYTLKYAERYSDALDVARQIARDHASLLERILAWQAVIYADKSLPLWLQDSLVNNLCLLTECALWVEARPPLDDWAVPGGAFGLIESPRGDPDLGCIPCDWYGNLPVVFFFPELALANIRSYKRYQRSDGAAPFWLGVLGDLPDFVTTSYDWQISLNGTCYVDLVDRVWQRTGDDRILREFYESVKKCNTMTMNLRPGPGGVISMPVGNHGMEWFEHGEWAGMCAHLGGLHLAQLRMMQRMAEAMQDRDYADQCGRWLADGTHAMETDLWNGSYYLNFFERETGKRSDDVMAYQLDGEWASQFHGLGNVFASRRIPIALDTIRRCNIALTPAVGAANFARKDGTALPAQSTVASYGRYAMFPAEVLVLAMTYIYAGEAQTGLDLARRHWQTIVCARGHGWDMPNIVRGDTGERVYGTDYYQSMMLWALPAALGRTDIRGCCTQGSLVDRVLLAGGRQNREPSESA